MLSKVSNTANMPPAGTKTKQTPLVLLFQLAFMELHSCSFLPSFPPILPLTFLPSKPPALSFHSLFHHYVSLSSTSSSYSLIISALSQAINTIKTWLQTKPPCFVSTFKGERS